MFEVAIVGAGYGGLGAAFEASLAGASVVLFEALNYPGGCASTFSRGGHSFDAGATLLAGLGDGQLFARLLALPGPAVETVPLDPVIALRAPGLRLEVAPERARFVETLSRLPGAPRPALARFFRRQERVASTLWELFEDPALLPPLSAAAFVRHLARLPRTAALLPLLGRSLGAVLEQDGLAGFGPLRVWADALCQITVQTSAARAEAPFALAALDYPFRGALHVRGGVGALAEGLVARLRARGVEVRFSDRVRSVRREGDAFALEGRRGGVRARSVLANVLPQALHALAGEALPRLQARVEAGWGACMLYLVVRDGADLPEGPFHLQLAADPGAPLVEGNHVFCSISGRGERPARTATVSTHVPAAALLALDEGARAARVAAIQERMRSTLRALAPEVSAAVEDELTASPRTFERFTRRPGGFVGGAPRTAGLGAYADLLRPPRLSPGLHLVGDSVFPGQSALAAALGGMRTAARALAR